MRVGKEAEEEALHQQNGNGDAVVVPMSNGVHGKQKLYKQLDRNSGMKLLMQQVSSLSLFFIAILIRSFELLANHSFIFSFGQ